MKVLNTTLLNNQFENQSESDHFIGIINFHKFKLLPAMNNRFTHINFVLGRKICAQII